jgi:hypothetical protein
MLCEFANAEVRSSVDISESTFDSMCSICNLTFVNNERNKRDGN